MAYDHWQRTVALCNVGIEGGRTAHCRVVGQHRGLWGSTEGRGAVQRVCVWSAHLDYVRGGVLFVFQYS